MTLEYVLLLLSTVLLAVSLFGQGRGPIDSFAKAGPALGAKLEYVLETGSDFEMLWSEPN